jgi:hypothetical protein
MARLQVFGMQNDAQKRSKIVAHELISAAVEGGKRKPLAHPVGNYIKNSLTLVVDRFLTFNFIALKIRIDCRINIIRLYLLDKNIAHLITGTVVKYFPYKLISSHNSSSLKKQFFHFVNQCGKY